MIREAVFEDFHGLTELYLQLHGEEIPQKSPDLFALWREMLQDGNYHIIVAEEEGKIVSTCVCVVIRNLTHGQRPYAVVENVVTDRACRNRGLATACLDFARDIALSERCYKMMLLTSSREESTLRFYENAGYNRLDKTGFVMWL